jgi:hypothetical protein
MPILVILIILALVFGVGAVIEGLFWLVLISVALFIAAAVFGFNTLRGRR